MLEREKLPERAASLGAKLAERLCAFAAEREDLVDGVRGRGLLQGLVLRDADRAAKVATGALERGVLVNVTAGRVVRFFPALNIPEDDLWPAVETVLAVVAG